MRVPWLQVIDLALGLADLRRARKRGADAARAQPGRRPLRHLEGRLAGVAVEALNDVFERDRRREASERDRRDQERRETERAQKLELIRQTADREIGRLRLLAGLALAGWIGSLFIAAMLAGTSAGPIVLMVAGWVLLLSGMTSALIAQRNLATALARVTDPDRRAPDSGIAGALVIWLLVVGLVLVAIAALTV